MVKTLNGTPCEANGLNSSNVDQRLRTPMYGVPFIWDTERKTVRQEKQQSAGSKHKVIGIAIIVATLGVFVILPIAMANSNNTSSSKNTIDTSSLESTIKAKTLTAQGECLDGASGNYDKTWKAADKDGDGSVAYSDGATDITTSYYNAVISCYQTYKTDDSPGYIADYQAKRQQETDKYTAWLESLKQPTYTPSYNDYRPSISCRSSSVGYSIQTTCN